MQTGIPGHNINAFIVIFKTLVLSYRGMKNYAMLYQQSSCNEPYSSSLTKLSCSKTPQ